MAYEGHFTQTTIATDFKVFARGTLVYKNACNTPFPPNIHYKWERAQVTIEK